MWCKCRVHKVFTCALYKTKIVSLHGLELKCKIGIFMEILRRQLKYNAFQIYCGSNFVKMSKWIRCSFQGPGVLMSRKMHYTKLSARPLKILLIFYRNINVIKHPLRGILKIPQRQVWYIPSLFLISGTGIRLESPEKT